MVLLAAAASMSVQATTILPADLGDLVRDMSDRARPGDRARRRVDEAIPAGLRRRSRFAWTRISRSDLGRRCSFARPGGRIGRFDSVA